MTDDARDLPVDTPLVTRYLNAFDAGLAPLAPAERAEVVAEIRQHIADAIAAGKPLDEVLQSLGPVDALARAYQLELLIAPRATAPEQPRSDRWLKIAGLLAVGSLPTFIIVVVLGALAVSLTLSGIVVMFAGMADSAGALPSWMTVTMEPWLAIVAGVVIAAVGLLCGWAMLAYLRLVVRLVKGVVPPTPDARKKA